MSSKFYNKETVVQSVLESPEARGVLRESMRNQKTSSLVRAAIAVWRWLRSFIKGSKP